MKSVSAVLAKTTLFAAAAIGLSACVAAAPEPVAYYPAPSYYAAPGYYYQPAPRYYYRPYYAPRPAYNSFSFSYSDRDYYRGHRGWHR